MSKTIFRKYFLACSLITLMSILILGTAVTITTARITNGQQQSLNRQNSDKVARLISSDYRYMDARVLQTYLMIFASASDSTAMVVDQDGKLMQSSDTQAPFYMQKNVSSSIMKVLKAGKVYTEVGNFGGVFDSVYNVSGAPVTDSSGSMIAAVFVFSRADNVYRIVYTIVNIFIICSLIVLCLSFVIISFVTTRLVRPLRDMSRAAKSFAKGDFSMRVPVYGNDEVGQLAAAFNNMASSLASLEDMRRTFVANVSHELKTPMTSIAGFVDGILDGTIPPDRERHYLKIVSDEVKRLSRLVRSFLDIANIEAGKLKINKTEFDAAETVRRVLIGFEQKIDEKGLEVVMNGLDNGIPVLDDPDMTHQILYNLIENAVKFANEHGTVELNAVQTGNKIYINVKNTGVGIPERDIPYVFERFYKTDKSRGLDKTGVGIGLYIVKSTLVLMGEDITVKSVEGSYCEFVFTLTPAGK